MGSNPMPFPNKSKQNMKKTIIAAFCVMGLVGCADTNSDIEPSSKKKDVPTYAEGFSELYGHTYINTFKDSKGRPHKVVVFDGRHSLAAIDLDANSYYK